MLSLRLARGTHPLVLLRRLLVTAASAGTSFLLLCTLAYAAAHPEEAGHALLRLLWCLIPLSATAQLAVVVARTAFGARTHRGLTAAGFGPARHTLLAAASTALFCALGSALALLAFLAVRGHFGGWRPSARLVAEFGDGGPLPLGAVLIMVAVAPLTAAGATAVCLRPPSSTSPRGPVGRRREAAFARFLSAGRPAPLPQPDLGDGEVTEPQPLTGATGGPRATAAAPPPGDAPEREAAAHEAPHQGTSREGAPRDGAAPEAPRPAPAPLDLGALLPPAPEPPSAATLAGLPWGTTLIAAGLALEAYTAHESPDATSDLLPFPGPVAGSPPGIVGGWALTVLGLILAGPGLTIVCGRLLAACRPGALRLLAGRALQEEAGLIGRPLGVLCAVAAGAYTVVELYGPALRSAGPLTGLGAALVMMCTTAAALTATLDVKAVREPTTAALRQLGTSRRALRTAATLRGAALLTLLAALTWGIAELMTLPLTR
ncbi:hypothetical protein [Streptomyces sp. SAJ15]|uniref:hypothetical protein n=1 Tax=Streptomyces sp. SAJ15 TaxID=2011095 RepID=UPI001185349E|nr:hypothetical protein [Streptomyces sp. SAJ15]TVL94369.1 hypothetical protein CD790_05235 [Streptomyces sp. SAJ15]